MDKERDEIVGAAVDAGFSERYGRRLATMGMTLKEAKTAMKAQAKRDGAERGGEESAGGESGAGE